MAYVRDKIYSDTNSIYKELSTSDDFREHSPDAVRKWCAVLRREDFCVGWDDDLYDPSSIDSEANTKSEATQHSGADADVQADSEVNPVSADIGTAIVQPELMQITRQVFLQVTQACVWELKEVLPRL